MTHAGSKNYMRDLRHADLVAAHESTAGNVGPRAPIYHLTTDIQRIETFIADLKAQKPIPRNRTRYGTLLERAEKDPSRHLHVMQDDTHYQPPMHRFKPFRDGLVAALFGPAAGAHA
ncbi:hypothetical protein [Duganella sp. BJB476]|uniref:hypothetical protein n=1 Tax=Duganella sp. BJB476 TaxID=1871176 RepID=UPI0011C1A665|nr:hypothetical protein [Duganella sp. BJB476]